jgi:hypothetical protein
MHPFAAIAATRHDELLADVARRQLLAENPDRVVPAPWLMAVRGIWAALRSRLPGRARNAATAVDAARASEHAAGAACQQDRYTTAG